MKQPKPKRPIKSVGKLAFIHTDEIYLERGLGPKLADVERAFHAGYRAAQRDARRGVRRPR
jgi:hypothetical protein